MVDFTYAMDCMIEGMYARPKGTNYRLKIWSDGQIHNVSGGTFSTLDFVLYYNKEWEILNNEIRVDNWFLNLEPHIKHNIYMDENDRKSFNESRK